MSSRPMRLGLVVLLVAVLAAGGLAIGHHLWLAATDPRSAQCADPAPALGQSAPQSTHRELDVLFTCEGARLAGTIYLPTGPGPIPVWCGYTAPAKRNASAGVGAGPWPGAIRTRGAFLRQAGSWAVRGRLLPRRSGPFQPSDRRRRGSSPRAPSPERRRPGQGGSGRRQPSRLDRPASRQRHPRGVRGPGQRPTVSERTANLYERLAGGEKGTLSHEEISRRLRNAGPSGYDPLPDLRRMTMPGLWLFGSADDKTPVPESVAVLDRLRASGQHHRRVFPDAGHGLLDVPPTAPAAPTTLITWIEQQVS